MGEDIHLAIRVLKAVQHHLEINHDLRVDRTPGEELETAIAALEEWHPDDEDETEEL